MRMSDALHVEEGAQPWLPGAGVTAGQVLDFFNVPRAGLLHQSGLTYYFECIIGDGESLGVWSYSHLSEDELEALLKCRGPEEFDALTPNLIKHRWVTIAIAKNDRIVEEAIFDAGDEGATGLARRMMERWERQREARAETSRMVGAIPG